MTLIYDFIMTLIDDMQGYLDFLFCLLSILICCVFSKTSILSYLLKLLHKVVITSSYYSLSVYSDISRVSGEVLSQHSYPPQHLAYNPDPLSGRKWGRDGGYV